VDERAVMWQNFFWACKLGAVLLAADNVVWQKKGKTVWQMTGSRGDYSAESISWPVTVLLDGIE
jgi:hypothetical protein